MKNRIESLIRAIPDVVEFASNTDRPGMDLTSVLNNSLDPQECRASCLKNPACKAFSLRKTFHACMLKSGVPAAVGASSDFVSGIVETGFEVGIDRPGFDISGSNPLSAASAHECQRLCTQNGVCAAFTFVPGTQACFLKGRIPGAFPNENVISGVPLRRGNFNRPGQDLPGMPLFGQTADGCEQACALRNDCFAYTHVNANGQCWLKRIGPDPVFDCPSCVSGTVKAIENNVDRPGSDIGSLTTDNERACAASCGLNAACRAWSWVKSSKNCFLKHATPGIVLNDNVVSGIKAGHEINMDRPGGDLTSSFLATPDPDECGRLCANNSSCKAWTLITKPANIIGGTDNRCLLKSTITAAVPRDGMISGLKGGERFAVF
jgi:hypothetical protein